MRQWNLGWVVGLMALLYSGSSLALEPSAKMGEGLYLQKGSNSCQFCHGADGTGGSVKEAAKLTEPKNWKIYKILGGDAAYAKNKADFLKKMEEATVNLIVRGAVAHGISFKKDWFDLKKAEPYNAQMLGLSGAASKKWLKRFKDKGVTKEIAAKSAYLFVQTLDSQKVFN